MFDGRIYWPAGRRARPAGETLRPGLIPSGDPCNRGITHYKLDWNESTIEPSPKVGEALQRLLGEGRSLHWYPDPGHEELCARLSAYVGCPPEHLLVTNGSDDALALICQTYIDAGDEVVAPFPTYRHFLQFAELANAAVQLIRKDCPFSFTCEDIEAALTRHSKIVYLANPNNPTGTLLIRRRSAGWPAVTRASCSWSMRRIMSFPAVRAPGGRPRCRTWS